MKKPDIRSYDRTPPRVVRFTSDATTSLRVMLQAAGFSPIPIMGKRPVVEDWPNKLDVSREEILSWEVKFPDCKSTGILTRNTPTFDCDVLNIEAAAAVEKLVRKKFGKLGRVLKRTGLAPKFCVPFRTEAPFAKIQIKLLPPGAGDDAEPEKLEFLGDGQQFVAFGIHPDTGQPYSWGKGSLGAPGKVWRKNLPPVTAEEARAFVDEATRILIEQHGYRPWTGKKTTSGTKEKAQAKAGNGWDNTQGHVHIDSGRAGRKHCRRHRTTRFHPGPQRLHDWQWCLTAGDRRTLRAVMQACIAKRDSRWTERFDDIDRAVESAVAKYAPPVQEHLNGQLFDPWAPFAAPEFPLEVLPPLVREFVVGQAEVLGCDVASMAMTTLGACSGALDHRCSLKMMRHGNWFAHPRLWLLLCGDPSRKKTPLIDAATWPLEQHQKRLQTEYKLMMQLAGDDKEKKPDPPSRLVVWDTTIEKLGELLARDNRGLLVKRDEFSGWIGSMEKYSGSGRAGASANRAFWLKAWDGGPYIVDRITRGEIFIDNLSVSLIGGIQPAKLLEISGLTSDGLLQRFLPIIMGASAPPIDRPINANAYAGLISQLLKEEHRTLSLSDAALEVTNTTRKYLFELEQSASGLADGFQAFVGKLAGYVGSLALLLHMLTDPKNDVVQKKIAENVDRLVVDFILRHGFEFFCMAEGAGNGDRLRKLASFLLTNGAAKVTASDLTTGVWDFRGLSLPEVNERVSPLVAANWMLPVDRAPVNHTWNVNPNVFTQFAERQRLEETRKTRLRELMNIARGGE